MLISDAEYNDCHPIQGYGKGFFRVNNKIYDTGIFIHPEGLKTWLGFKDLSFLDEGIFPAELLFIGTGGTQQTLTEEVTKYLNEKEVNFEIYTTPVACRAYNITISAHRNAGALLIPLD